MKRADNSLTRPNPPPHTGGGGRLSSHTTLGLHDWVVNWWAGGGGTVGSLLRVGALPLEMGFRLISGVWGRMYDHRMLPLQRAPVPVISVGNITVGGSGKTPLAGWLLKELRKRGEKPALVTRGYGNDEVHLHRRWAPECVVIAEEDRAYGAWMAARKGATVVVLDDGFQHRHLARELDMVLLATNTPWKVRLLPRGPFREPFSAFRRAGVVILTQKGLHDDVSALESRVGPYVREAPIRVAFVPDGWIDLDGEPVDGPEGEYLAVAGVGDPESVSRILMDATGRPGELLSFPDHHGYSWPDVQNVIDRAGARTIVTTEKDAVKLEAFRDRLKGLKVLKLRVEVLEGEERLWAHLEAVLNIPRAS